MQDTPAAPAQGPAHSRGSVSVCRRDELINQKIGPCAHAATCPFGALMFPSNVRQTLADGLTVGMLLHLSGLRVPIYKMGDNTHLMVMVRSTLST